MSNNLDPDQAQHFVGPDLDPNCFQRFQADATSRLGYNPLYMETSFMSTSTNSEYPDAMPLNVTFHQGLHCLLKKKIYSYKKCNISFKLLPDTPRNSTMDYPKFVCLI